VNFYRYGIPNGEGLSEEETLNHLMLWFGVIKWSEVDDKIIWKLNYDGVYSVKSMCGILSSHGLPNYSCNSFHGVWKELVPSKY